MVPWMAAAFVLATCFTGVYICAMRPQLTLVGRVPDMTVLIVCSRALQRTEKGEGALRAS